MALSLVLEVAGPQGHSLGEARRKVFDGAGGRIGRAPDCDWVLSSRYISRHHATVSYVDGAFRIASVGENGVAVNDVVAKLPRLEARVLASGDRLYIDEYEIMVSIAEAPEPSDPDSQTAQWEEATERRAREPPAGATATHRGPVVASQPVAGVFDVAAFLRAAGLDPQSVSPEMAPVLGQIVRLVAQGMIDVLGARAQFRSQFHLPLTRVRASQNNPLKFAPTAEEALTAMFRTRARGYMPPLEAFEDAFDDIRFHLLATLAGMRAGLESMLKRLDPKRIQQMSDRRYPGFLARFGAQRRYWDRYVDLFEEMTGNADAAFQQTYGEEFSSAYEQQLEELKRSRAKPAR
jgi:predicted component of type VI protein secretion system